MSHNTLQIFSQKYFNVHKNDPLFVICVGHRVKPKYCITHHNSKILFFLSQVSVTQQYETNVTSAKKRRTLHHIGFAVYEVPPAMTRLTPQYVLEHVSRH